MHLLTTYTSVTTFLYASYKIIVHYLKVHKKHDCFKLKYYVDLNTGYNLILSPVKLINFCYELAKQYCSKLTKFYILGKETLS